MSTSTKNPKNLIGADIFHQRGITGKNITVAILDSGLAPHPDIAKNRILTFKDFVNGRLTPYDDCSHGTHVAGIIGSSIIGIAPQASLVPIKILNQDGDGSIEQFVSGIKWILYHHQDYHIKIVNISIGGNTEELRHEKNILNKWVKRLWYEGLIVCCSAGNNGPGPNSVASPGNCKEVITVGSSDGKNFSSAGPLLPYITKPEIVAPGYHILSMKPYGGYQIKNGTSMSVPFVSGAIALLLQLDSELTNDEVKLHLMNTAQNIQQLPFNSQGAGMLNLNDFLSQVPR